MAQQYTPTLVVGNSWKIAHAQLAGVFIDSLTLNPVNDTTFNLLISGDFYFGETVSVGKVMNNNTNSKIWSISPESDTVLIVDLDLAVNDSIADPRRGRYLVVDSLAIINQRKHIFFNYFNENFGDRVVFIEGIGTIEGFLQQIAVGMPEPHLLVCMTNETGKVYQTPNANFSECEYIGALGFSTSETANTNIYLRKSTSGRLQVYADDDYEIQAYSSTGRMLYETQVRKGENEIIIDNQGVMVFVFSKNGEFVSTLKYVNYDF